VGERWPTQAVLLRNSNPLQASDLEQLRTQPGLQCLDTYREQLGDLLRTRCPGRSFSRQELAAEIDRQLQDQEVERLGIWVHYPWSDRLIHLLDATEFAELRTSRNRNKITREEQTALSQKRVGVVGLSVGQSVALTMALERSVGELRLADYDTLDLSNLNRLRAGVHEIGLPKVVITARQIAEIDPFLAVRCFHDGLLTDNLDQVLLDGGPLDRVIDECDDLVMKGALRRRARELGIPVVMDTSDRGLLDIERFDREPDRPLFHGLVDPAALSRVKDLSSEEKIPLVADLLGRDSLSPRAAASMLEIGESLTTWPQLGSSVTLGGGVAADAARRILLGELTASGRYYVDLETAISNHRGLYRKPRSLAAASSSLLRIPSEPEDCRTSEPAVASARPDCSAATLIEAAVQAPSGGNCQPWRFLARDQQIWVLHDRQRSASFLDFHDSAALASLGAAIENIVLAAHAAGSSARVQTFPTDVPPTTPDLPCIAKVDLRDTQQDAVELEDHCFDHLHAAIFRRQTCRSLGTRQALDPSEAEVLRAASRSVPGCNLQLIEDQAELDEIGDILGRGDQIRMFHRQLHAELMRELRWTPEQTRRTRDGIDVETLELSRLDRVGLDLCRSFESLSHLQRSGGGHKLTKASSKAVAAASAVGLIVTEDHDAEDFVRGGRSMQRLWLTAQSLDLAVQPLSALPFLFARLSRGSVDAFSQQLRQALQELRQRYLRLFDLAPHCGEVLLVRIARATPSRVRALRRPISEVLQCLQAEE
jgi:molybdopterin/thiamine biosynthesis adenylyltransferase